MPEIPSAKEVEANALDIADMEIRLLKKVEELTLYMIEMKKENEILKQDSKILHNEITKLKSVK